jgi:RNA polymerase sigma-70 factor (ECF subfamily)
VRSVFGLALRRLRDLYRAEDAVQETFAAVLRSARSYRPERGPAAPWLYAVARNAVVDRQRARYEPPSEVPETASCELGPADRAESSFVRWRVHRALEELPEKEREVVELAYWSELSQSEIAGTSTPLGTVKTRTRSAARQLAGVLGELGARRPNFDDFVARTWNRRSASGCAACDLRSSRSHRRALARSSSARRLR